MNVRDLEVVRQRLASQPGVPVMAVDELVAQALGADEVGDIRHPFRNELPQVFLGDEVLTAAAGSDDANSIRDLLDLRLTFEAAGEDIHRIAHPGEALAQFENIDDLPACIRQAELRLCGHIAVGGDHHDPLLGWHGRSPFETRRVILHYSPT